MKDSNYINQLIKQVENSQNPGVSTYFKWMYSKLDKPLANYSTILEIGAGAGISKNFLNLNNVIRTDLLAFDAQGVKGKIDAQALPFAEASFEAIFGVDMLHHAPYPHKVLAECLRVVKAPGQIIFIEPYVSPLSYLVYKLFHDEKTSIRVNLNPLLPAVSEKAADGNQTICQELFFSRRGKRLLKLEYKEKIKIHRSYFSPLAFFATGGINRPLKTSPKLIQRLIEIETKIPQWILKFLSSRQIVVIQKL